MDKGPRCSTALLPVEAPYQRELLDHIRIYLDSNPEASAGGSIFARLEISPTRRRANSTLNRLGRWAERQANAVNYDLCLNWSPAFNVTYKREDHAFVLGEVKGERGDVVEFGPEAPE